MEHEAVSNSEPLIHLARIGKLWVLNLTKSRKVYDEVNIGKSGRRLRLKIRL